MAVVQRNTDWLAAKVGEELVMMSAKSGRYLGLSPVGARIWELIDAPADIEAVIATLQEEYAVTPDVCRNEVVSFLDELVKHGAATLDSQ
jgi:hypothetical protein